MKILNINENFDGQEQMMFMRESITLHKVRHPAITKFYGINFRSFSDPMKLEPSIITEFISRLSLKKIFDNEQKGFTNPKWTSTKKFISLLGISHAMSYLHKLGIFHMDLKPENILIDDDYNPKISDFGLAKCFETSLSKSIQMPLTGAIGTSIYIAPELFNNSGLNNHDNSAADVFAFGILAYEIVTGKMPYYELLGKVNLNQLIKEVRSGYRPKFTNEINEKMKKLILRCLSQDPKDRPSFEEIFNKLSTDFSYFKEDVDKDQVNFYINKLKIEELNTKNEKESTQINEKEIKNVVNLSNERKCYFEIIESLTKSSQNLGEIRVIDELGYTSTILFTACRYGNLELVKYLISLNKIDLKSVSSI